VRNWLEALSPDFVATGRRFPLAIILALGGTAVAILAANQVLGYADKYWGTVCLGFLAGAAFAVGGVIFGESRPDLPRTALVLRYLVPVLVVGAHALNTPSVIFPWPLLAIAILWTSVAGFTRWGAGAERVENQKRFWWLNYQAIATACVAGVALIVVLIGLWAIQRALDSLFGLSMDWLLQKWLIPIFVIFVTPVYWLSTIPRLEEYQPTALDEPDVLARAVGFLGQFVLAPLLIVYGAILLAYTVQIVVTQHLPDGTISWMVMGFVIVGAATWLVLYPPFMASHGLTKLFRRAWFALTLVPLVLFAIALWVRVDSYGLTPERVVLVAGGVWAALLALIFLSGRGDIRMIPGLAAIIGLLALFGPWSLENASISSQAGRLSAAMDRAGVVASRAAPVKWSVEDATIARAAIWYLYDQRGQDALHDVLAQHQVPLTMSGDAYALEDVWDNIQLTFDTVPSVYHNVGRPIDTEIELGGMTTFLGYADISQTNTNVLPGITLKLDGADLLVRELGGPDRIAVPLSSWAASERQDTFANPVFDFSFRGVPYRFIAEYGSIEQRGDRSDLGRHFTYLRGLLFRGPPAPEPPATPTP